MFKNFLAFLAAGIWISISEFIRNELLFKSYWIQKYESLGMHFPSASANNAMWGVWSFLLAGMTLFLANKLHFIEAILSLWIMAFLMMWIVVGNLNVLPLKLLFFAVPLSALEVFLAVFLCKKISR
jgi:hypothetical protein